MHDLKVAIFGETEWSNYLRMKEEGTLCRERMSQAVWQRSIKPRGRDQDAEKRFSFNYQIKPEKWSRFQFVVLVDCNLEFYDAHPPTLKYKFTLKSGSSHLPADERYQTTVHLLLLIALVGFGLTYVILLIKQYRRTGTTHMVCLLLGAAYVCQTVSVMFELLHLLKYGMDGRGFRFRTSWIPLDFLSEVMQGLAEYVIEITLISLAAGWTLSDTAQGLGGWDDVDGGGLDGRPDDDGRSGSALKRAVVDNKFVKAAKTKMRSTVKAMKSPVQVFMGKRTHAAGFFGGVLVYQIVFELWGRRYEEDFNAFHDHEHWPGYALMYMRCALAAMFYMGIQATIKAAPRDSPTEAFLEFLKFAGLTWFLVFPVVVFSSQMFAPVNRHMIVTFTSIAGQSAALGVMLYAFLTRGNAFSKVSTVGTMKDVGDMFGSAMRSAGSGLGRSAVLRKVATD